MVKPPCGNYGDVDNSGEVNINDAGLVVQYIQSGWDSVKAQTPLSEAEFRKRADVDGDGVVTDEDYRIIANYAMNVPGFETFPICSLKPSTDWIYWLIVAGIAIIVLYMIGGKKW